jgi:hypothetical protein
MLDDVSLQYSTKRRRGTWTTREEKEVEASKITSEYDRRSGRGRDGANAEGSWTATETVSP